MTKNKLQGKAANMVSRVHVEKKPGFDVEAKALERELREIHLPPVRAAAEAAGEKTYIVGRIENGSGIVRYEHEGSLL